MSNKKYLAIDLGASSGRGIVGSYDGERLTLRIFHEIKQPLSLAFCEGEKRRGGGICVGAAAV